MANDLKHTLSLPKTDFPMRGDLPKREPARLASWEKQSLYASMQSRRLAQNAPVFVLHDGPPFTNGDVHIGTALNKSLKDITLRYKTLRGYRTPYVPGWDCHGLPIEQKVTKELQASGTVLPTAELRSRCDEFAEGWISRQTASFKRLGVQADWGNQYKTKAPAFEADILRTFAAFVEQDIVYRSKKPVYWSIPFETALAEAEIEYAEHTSVAIWVKFLVPAAELARFGLPGDKPLSVVIWTTTPWTIPANLAIAVHPETEYAVADLGAERILVAAALLPAVVESAKLPAVPEIVQRIRGAELEKLGARHPFIDRAAPVVLADYVTTDSGTGCVHTAPGHGAEDYLTGLKYGLEIYCPVGDDGRYLDDGKVPADLVGITCLETVEELKAKKPSPANLAVLKKLATPDPVTGHVALLAKAKYVHSYPHCWRSKTPIIFRAVDQWFVSLDKAGHRTRALAAIKGVQWFPAWGQARITGAVEARPDWCISRQRSWGVPIIAFYDANKKAYLDASVVRAVADKIAAHPRGTNLWYEASAAEFLAGSRAARRLACRHRADLRSRHARRLDRLRQFSRRRAAQRSRRHPVARRSLPRRLGPAPRLVSVLALDQRHRARRRALQGGAHPRLHRRRGRQKDLQVRPIREAADLGQLHRRLRRRRHPPLARLAGFYAGHHALEEDSG